VTVGEALATFEHGWVAAQPVTPRTAYERTLRMLAFWLEREGRSTDDDVATLRADDAEASRKVALHVARLGAGLAESCDRPDLALDRDRLRALV
jgi:hypothetical protein